MAAAGAQVTTVDHAGAVYLPSPEEVAAKAGVSERVAIVREYSSYTWWLKDCVAARSDEHGNVEPCFNFVYLDGAKNWTIDGLAVILIEKLLRPGRWLLMDDLDWTYGQDPGRSITDGIHHRELSERELTKPHLRAVFDLIVARRQLHRAAPAGRAVGLGAQGPGRTAPLQRRDVASARRPRREHRAQVRSTRTPPSGIIEVVTTRALRVRVLLAASVAAL